MEPTDPESSPILNSKMYLQMEDVLDPLDVLSERWRIHFPINPNIRYQYPTPNAFIINNIAHALASVPKFYTQVLHLMNKMSLPAPFEKATPRPPILEMKIREDNCTEKVAASLKRDDSEEESEMESDGEASKIPAISTVTKKRTLRQSVLPTRKRNKLSIASFLPLKSSGKTVSLNREDVFDGSKFFKPDLLKPIDVNITQEKLASSNNEADHNTVGSNIAMESGFGKINPVGVGNTKSCDECVEEIMSSYISLDELDQGRLSLNERNSFSVFRNYHRGDVNHRLYIKNLSKAVSEKDIRYIFGRYVDWTDTEESNMFDIRLMQEGRMKGQAFVSLPNEQCALNAIDDVNGFMLHGRPLIVSFARSAKPKTDEK